MNSQIDFVRDHLQRGKTITPLEALSLCDSMRLSAIIFNLKKEGMLIDTTFPREGKRFAVYKMRIKENLFDKLWKV